MGEPPVVLVGLMGAGKTSVATRLAALLGRPVRDSDQDLEQRYGMTAEQQYHQHGAGVLHAREAAALRDALAAQPPPVVAAAASVVDDPGCRAALAGGYVVWLDAPPGVLAARLRRIRAEDHRPEYHPDLDTMLTGQYEQRADRFREVADLVVDVGDATPDEAAEAIRAALAGQ